MDSIKMISKKVRPILKQHQIKKASIFGSYAKNIARKNSDIDLAVDVPLNMGLFGLAALKLDLEDVLGQQVDVVTFRSLHPKLKPIISKESISIL